MPLPSPKTSAVLLATGILLGLTLANFGDIAANQATIDIGQWLLLPFFALIGIELRSELSGQGSAALKRLLAPALSALFGAVIPVVILLAIGGPTVAPAWPVPVATDLTLTLAAFAMATGASRNGWRTYLLAFAVFDDVLGTIALNATHPSFSPSLIGVALGLVLSPRNGKRFEAALAVPVHYLVVPAFAALACLVPFSQASFGALFVGILLRPIGKFCGISIGYLIGRKHSGLKDSHREWIWISGLGLLGGVGFTVAFATADLALAGNESMAASAKVATMIAAAVSLVAGGALLRRASRAN